jgi:cell division ATPase FtsA
MSLVALLDIGSTKVSGVLISRTKNKKTGTVVDFPQVLFAASIPVTLQNRMDTTLFFNDVAQATKEVLKALVKSGHGTPKQTICILSAPFYASRTSIISRKEKESFVCSEKLLESWIVKEIADFPGHEILESSILDISLNGYRVISPFGQKAEEIEISHYLSIAPKEVLAQLRQAISGVIHSSSIQFHSFAFVFFRVLDFLTDDDKNYLALEFNGEISELSLIWQDSLRETVSFPLGENWLIQELATGLNTTPEEVRSILRAYAAAHTHAAIEQSLENILDGLRSRWVAAFREALNQALANSFLPGELFLLGEPSLSPLIKRWLESEDWQNLVLANANLAVKIIDPVTFASLYNKIPKNIDISTLVEIIFYDTILNK